VAEWRSGWQRSLCIAKDLPQHRWRGAAWNGESGVPEKVPLRPPSQVIPVTEGKPQIGYSKAIHMVPRSKREEQGPRRTVKRKEGLKVNQRPRRECPLRSDQPGGYGPARNRVPKILRDSDWVSTNGFEDQGKTDWGRLTPIFEGMRKKSAQNSRSLSERRRRPLFGQQACREDPHPRGPGDPAADSDCKPPLRPPYRWSPGRARPLLFVASRNFVVVISEWADRAPFWVIVRLPCPGYRGKIRTLPRMGRQSFCESSRRCCVRAYIVNYCRVSLGPRVPPFACTVSSCVERMTREPTRRGTPCVKVLFSGVL